MRECWSEGKWRAWLDRELPPAEMDFGAAHLEVCAGCRAVHEEIAQRAARVSVLLGVLETNNAADRLLTRAARNRAEAARERRSPRNRLWVAAAAALAAGIAVGVFAIPKRSGPPAPPAVAFVGPVAVPQSPAPAVEPQPVVEQARGLRRAAKLPAPRPVERTEDFIALDSDPIGNGLIVRVAIGPENVLADVVFSADGRARAYRLVDQKPN